MNQIAFSGLCIGLDNAGKTTLLRNLSKSNRMEIFPTSTMELHYIQSKYLEKLVLIYDMSGNGRHRDSWRLMYKEVQAIIYVIDSSQKEDRFILQRILLDEIFNDEYVKKSAIPFLFLLNKQDCKSYYEKEDIIKYLGLDQKKIKNRFIFKETSGFKGQGLVEAFELLAGAIQQKKN
ncbi:hypothetical protein pb186bvf_016265 [Paramecium bursaria]